LPPFFEYDPTNFVSVPTKCKNQISKCKITNQSSKTKKQRRNELPKYHKPKKIKKSEYI